MCLQPRSWAWNPGESASTFLLFLQCPWPLPHRGPFNAWHRPSFPPWREPLISAWAYVRCLHGEWGSLLQGKWLSRSLTHQGHSCTGTWSLTSLIWNSHILILPPTVKVFPALATRFSATALSRTQGILLFSFYGVGNRGSEAFCNLPNLHS